MNWDKLFSYFLNILMKSRTLSKMSSSQAHNKTTKILNLKISTNKTEFPYQTRYPSTMALVEFKIKLELVVGIYKADMKLELRSPEGKFIAELVGDDRTLEELGVRDQCIVHVHDTNEAANNPCLVEPNKSDQQTFYVMPDDKYESQKDTARKWKQELLAAKATASPRANGQSVEVPDNFRPGKRCSVQIRGQPARPARIAFVGPTHFGQNPGRAQWVGVVYDEAIGKNDGSLEGHRYFQCQPAHGGFVQPRSIVEVFESEEAQNSLQCNQSMEIIEEM